MRKFYMCQHLLSVVLLLRKVAVWPHGWMKLYSMLQVDWNIQPRVSLSFNLIVLFLYTHAFCIQVLSLLININHLSQMEKQCCITPLILSYLSCPPGEWGHVLVGYSPILSKEEVMGKIQGKISETSSLYCPVC